MRKGKIIFKEIMAENVPRLMEDVNINIQKTQQILGRMNFAKYFLHLLHAEREHAEKLMKLQNQQGKPIFLQDTKKPDGEDWENGLSTWSMPYPWKA